MYKLERTKWVVCISLPSRALWSFSLHTIEPRILEPMAILKVDICWSLEILHLDHAPQINWDWTPESSESDDSPCDAPMANIPRQRALGHVSNLSEWWVRSKLLQRRTIQILTYLGVSLAHISIKEGIAGRCLVAATHKSSLELTYGINPMVMWPIGASRCCHTGVGRVPCLMPRRGVTGIADYVELVYTAGDNESPTMRKSVMESSSTI
jgi:hypothetical protein